MADTIIKHDSGLMGLILGGLIVWLFFKYRQEQLASEEEKDAAAQAGTSANCGSTGTIEQIVPGSPDAHTSETDSGRFIGGMSPTYN